MTLARALRHSNHKCQLLAMYEIKRYSVVELNEDQSITLLATTTTLSRKELFVWGILSKHAFQIMYVYLDLIDSQVRGDAQANVLKVIEEMKLSSYHHLRTSVFSSLEISIRRDTGQLIPFTSDIVHVLLHFRHCAFFNMLLPMNNHFHARPQHVISFIQRSNGNISVYGGTHPYGQGGNGVSSMFRSLGSLRCVDYGLRTTAGRALSFVCSTGLSRANIER